LPESDAYCVHPEGRATGAEGSGKDPSKRRPEKGLGFAVPTFGQSGEMFVKRLNSRGESAAPNSRQCVRFGQSGRVLAEC